MSTNRGTARSYSRQLAEATKLNGVVMTSSPSPIPSAAHAEMEAGRAAGAGDPFAAAGKRGQPLPRTPR